MQLRGAAPVLQYGVLRCTLVVGSRWVIHAVRDVPLPFGSHGIRSRWQARSRKKLIDLLEERKKEVEALIRPVNGFVSYSLIRTADGGASVTVCQDKAGTDESLRVAREWIAKNASNTGASPPTVVEGSVILQLS